MSRCDECLHWDGSDTDNRGVPDLGRCRKAMQIWDATDWEEDRTDPEGYPARTFVGEATDTMVFVADSSDYSARLLTRKDFFCAHFSAKNPGLLEPSPRNWLRELIERDDIQHVEVSSGLKDAEGNVENFEVVAVSTSPFAPDLASRAPTIQQAAEFVLTGLLRS